MNIKYTSYLVPSLAVLILTIAATPSVTFAEHEAVFEGGYKISTHEVSLSHGENCDYPHFHGSLNGTPDPAPYGCGHGIVTILEHDEASESDDSDADEKKEDEKPSWFSRQWTSVKGAATAVRTVIALKFGGSSSETDEETVDTPPQSGGDITPKDVADVVIQGATQGFSPLTVHDSVEIVKDSAPDIKLNADNARAYFDAYPDAPSRERYTLKDQNPEKNAPFPKLYRWFWGLFE